MKLTANFNGYEKLAQDIYSEILNRDGLHNINVQHNVTITGSSGVDHQVDVFWEFVDAGESYRKLIDCKNYSKTVSLIHARNMLSLVTDIPNSQGIIITTVGFQSGVKRFCEHYGIALKRIRPPMDSDWDGYFQHFDIELHAQRNSYSVKSITIREERAESRALSVRPDEIEIEDEKFTGKRTLLQWLDMTVRSQNIDVVEEIELKPENAHLIAKSERIGKIECVVLESIARVTTRRINIDATTIVAAVLEDIATQTVEHTKLKPRP
jgi:hypothetical protein